MVKKYDIFFTVTISLLSALDRVKSGNFGPVGFSPPPDNSKAFMSTAFDYPSNDHEIMKRHHFNLTYPFLGHFGGYRRFSSSLVMFK